MLLEDKVIYEIKKENVYRVFKEDVLTLCKELSSLELKMISEGWKRKDINAACRSLVDEADSKFHQRLINESWIESLSKGALSHLMPGVTSYFKLQLINYICRKLGIPLDSPFWRFLRNVVKNIKFTDIYGYFQEGKCPLIVETLIGAALDQLVEFIIQELGSAGYDQKTPEQADDSSYAGSYVRQLGDKMIEAGLPDEVLKFFGDLNTSMPGGMFVQILEDHIKRYLAPPLILSLSRIICDGLDFQEISSTVEDSFKSTTKKESERKEIEKQSIEKKKASKKQYKGIAR